MVKQFYKQLNFLLGKVGFEIKRIAMEPTGELAFIAFQLFQYAHPKELVLQIGASDGQFNDPIAKLVQHGSNPALLIEPDPSNFYSLTMLYKNYPHVKLINAAIGDTNAISTLYTVIRKGRWLRSPHASQLSSFSRNHLIKHGVLENEIKPINVPSMTIDSVLTLYEVEKVGFVLCDTEGYDSHVVEQILDLKVKPYFLCFEFIHNKNYIQKLCEKLNHHGYHVLFDKQNCLAYLS